MTFLSTNFLATWHPGFQLSGEDEKILSNDFNVHHNEARKNTDSDNSNRLQCERCGRSFASNKTLTKHIQNVHENKRVNATCEICGKTMSKISMEKHQKSVHFNEKPFKCNICSKRFSKTCSLKWHYNKHSGDKPYKCSFCDKSYSLTPARIQHELVHKGGCECKVCGLRFKVYGELALHKKTTHGLNSTNSSELSSDNSSLACKICGKISPSYGALFQHKRYHHSGKECECDVCGLKCKNPVALKSHKHVHDDFLKFGCSLCDKKFRFVGTFYLHRKKHKNQTATVIKLTESTTKMSLGSNRKNSKKAVVCDISSKPATHSQNNRKDPFSSPQRLQVEMENDNMEPPDSPEDAFDYEPGSDCFESGDHPVLEPQSETVENSTSNALAAIPTVSSILSSSTTEVTEEIVYTPSDIKSTVSSSVINFPPSNIPFLYNELKAQEIPEENQSAVVIVEGKYKSHFTEGDLKVGQSNTKENVVSFAVKDKLGDDSESAATAKAEIEAECTEVGYYESDDNNVFEIGDSFGEKKLKQFEQTNLHTETISRNLSKWFPDDPFPSQLFVSLTKLKEYKCQACNESFFHENELKIHKEKRYHTRKRMLEKLDAAKKETRRSSKKFKCEPKENKRIRHACKICDAKLTSIKKLRLHYRKEHPGIKSFQCDKCYETFGTQEYLENHNRRIHLGIKDKYKPLKPRIRKKSAIKIKNWICEECGQAFDKPSELELHKKRHAGIKDFKCEECGKAFNRAFVLKEHKKRHTGIKDFFCEECGAAFFRKNELNDHVQIVHQKHDRKKEYRMKNKDKIKSWKKPKPPTNRPFSCQLCSVKFSKEIFLKNTHSCMTLVDHMHVTFVDIDLSFKVMSKAIKCIYTKRLTKMK